MYATLILYTQPQRPLLNPKFDLFAFLDTQQFPPLFPARVVDRIQLMLPEKCRTMEEWKIPQDTWDFVSWQVEEKQEETEYWKNYALTHKEELSVYNKAHYATSTSTKSTIRITD